MTTLPSPSVCIIVPGCVCAVSPSAASSLLSHRREQLSAQCRSNLWRREEAEENEKPEVERVYRKSESGNEIRSSEAHLGLPCPELLSEPCTHKRGKAAERKEPEDGRPEEKCPGEASDGRRGLCSSPHGRALIGTYECLREIGPRTDRQHTELCNPRSGVMPSCLVNQCLSKSGRKGQSDDIILHKFPNDLPRIRSWLSQTGQRFEDLEVLANKVLEGAQKKEKKYFMCSNHFTVDSYRITHYGRALKQDAVPTIFPAVEEGESIIEESLRKDRSRSKKRRSENEPQFHVVFYSEIPETEYVKPGMASVSTQTEYNLTNSEVTFTSKKPSAVGYEDTVRFPHDILEVKIKSEIKEEGEDDM